MYSADLKTLKKVNQFFKVLLMLGTRSINGLGFNLGFVLGKQQVVFKCLQIEFREHNVFLWIIIIII